MNDNPADERFSFRRKLTLSQELEVLHQILPHPRNGGTHSYPVLF